MNSKSKLVVTASEIIEERGRCVIEEAVDQIVKAQYGIGPVSSALKYYARAILSSYLPMLPALASISCEMVNGNSQETKQISTAMVLIASSCDLHDDIIDKSTNKYSKKTVLGMFGASVTLLAGDALVTQGLALLQDACETLPKEQKRAISRLTTKALFEIICAEAKETQLWEKNVIPPNDYLEITRMKGAIGEVTCKIGGILAGAGSEEISFLGEYGRVLGMLSHINEEFMDLDDFKELENRIKNECPPLPLLYALQDREVGRKIGAILDRPDFNRNDADELTKMALSSTEVHKLAKLVKKMALQQTKTNLLLSKNKAGREATIILDAVSEVLD